MSTDTRSIKKVLELDQVNASEALSVLCKDLPVAEEAIDSFVAGVIEVAGRLSRRCKYDDSERTLSQVSHELSVPKQELLKLLDESLRNKEALIGESKASNAFERAMQALLDARSDLVRTLLVFRIQRDFVWGVSDILRGRTTPAIGMMRVQLETLAILKLLSSNKEVAHEWLIAHVDSEREHKFWNRYRKRIRRIIEDWGLESYWERSSGIAMHSRVGGVARGFLNAQKYGQLGEIGLQDQEIEDYPELLFSIADFLRLHRKVMEILPSVFPEIPEEELESIKPRQRFLETEDQVWERNKRVHYSRRRDTNH